MTTLLIDLPEPVAQEIERRARARGESVSSFLGDLVRQHLKASPSWPDRFFERVVGGWQGEPLERPEQPPVEVRDSL